MAHITTSKKYQRRHSDGDNVARMIINETNLAEGRLPTLPTFTYTHIKKGDKEHQVTKWQS